MSNEDENAVKEILNFCNTYISKVCLYPGYHANANISMQLMKNLKENSAFQKIYVSKR